MHKTVFHMYYGGGGGGCSSSGVQLLISHHVKSEGILSKMLVLGINEMVFAFPLKFQKVISYFLFTRPIFFIKLVTGMSTWDVYRVAPARVFYSAVWFLLSLIFPPICHTHLTSNIGDC